MSVNKDDELHIGVDIGKASDDKTALMIQVGPKAYHFTGEEADAILQLIHAREEALKQDLLFDLDEIDNKPWRVFRQLAEIMPEYADEYNRYKVFYSFGGGHKVRKLIEEFEKSDDYKEYVAAVAKTQLKENKGA